MAKLQCLLLGMLAVHCISAAPSDVRKHGDDKIENTDAEEKLVPLSDHFKGRGDSRQAKRHKRMYDFYVGSGHPPMNPISYPPYGPPYGGAYGPPGEDPLAQIYRKLQDIATDLKQRPHPPPPFPIYFPVLYIPTHVGCGCASNLPPRRNNTSPDINTRFPDMEDSRQNWGFVETPAMINNNDDDDDDVRPLSFDPIRPSRPPTRSPPPVDHGSTQGDDLSPTAVPSMVAMPSNNKLSGMIPVPTSEPTACDAAVFVCCERFSEKYSGCFVANGCSGVAQTGNNCDEAVINNVIAKYQRYYGQKRG